MIDLCVDIGYKSINHHGEQLCGDHIDVIEQEDGATVIVLADGLGSGVKASILSTLTSKIISTMLAEGLSIEECVETIAQTLPVCSKRGIAYSTFTIFRLINSSSIEIIQYDNPHVIVLRDGKKLDYEKDQKIIGGKKIFHSIIELKENDLFVAMTDGCPHAGIGNVSKFGWKEEDIAVFLEKEAKKTKSAKVISASLVDECNRLYENAPGDDVTSVVVKVRKRVPMNLMFGPPADYDDNEKMVSSFLSQKGKHIVCGGTSSTIVAEYLKKPLEVKMDFVRPDLPPVGKIEGVDVVTEGVITMSRVLNFAKDYLEDNETYKEWGVENDGASTIARLLIEEATDINFFVGRAINPAHQNPNIPINFNIKMNIIEELSSCLKRMGKKIKVSFF